MRPRYHLVTLLVCLAILGSPPATLWTHAQGGVQNGGFEGSFSDRTREGHVIVADGWDWFFQDGPGQDQGFNWRPTFREDVSWRLDGRRVHSGGKSHKFGNTWATHNAGLFQRVGVPRGSLVSLSAWTLLWSTQTDDEDKTKNEGGYRVMVGIDPTGGTNWAAGSVRWSESRMEANTWIQLAISAQAEADAVTVFLRGQCEFSVKHNESYWDDVTLNVTRPTPRPTNTPAATRTPTITPTPSLTPTPTPSPTPVVFDVCVLSFDDKNANGVRDEGEGSVPGAYVALLDAQQSEVVSCLTTGYDEPFCIKGVPAGSYDLRIRSPLGFEATAPVGEGPLALDKALTLQLAYRRYPTSTPEPTKAATRAPAPTPTRASTGGFFGAVGRAIFGVSGILVAALAVALLLGPRYLRLER